jgi:hypothetical protein
METSCWPSLLSKACTWLHPTRSPVVAGYLGQKFVLPRARPLAGGGVDPAAFRRHCCAPNCGVWRGHVYAAVSATVRIRRHWPARAVD